MTHKSYPLLALCLVTGLRLSAQHPELNNPTTYAVFSGGSSLVDRVENICFILGAVCAVIGGVTTYTNFLDGEERFYVGVRNWFGSCVAFVVFPYLIRSITGF